MEKFEFTHQERAQLERLGIEALILFGSRAQGIARARSDYDFGVLVKDRKVLYGDKERKEMYEAVYNLLSDKINQLVNIDIVFLEDAPMELQCHAAKYGVAVYERRPHVFLQFKERVMLLAADFAPLRDFFHRAIFSQIP